MDASPFDRVAATAGAQWGLFTTQQAFAAGFTRSRLSWQCRPGGPYERVAAGVYRLCDFPAPALQLLGAALLARGTNAVACGHSAGWALGLDGVERGRIELAVLGSGSHKQGSVHRCLLESHQIVPIAGSPFRMTDPVTTLMQLAGDLDDRRWEWTLESALRKLLVKLNDVVAEADRWGSLHRSGSARAKRVLRGRPPGPPTGSQLETEFAQLIRGVPQIPEPERQYPVRRHGRIEARLDFAFPAVGAYTEVLGGQHRDSLQYDASRETLIAATLGWLASEVTSREIRQVPTHTIRRMIEFISSAAARGASIGP